VAEIEIDRRDDVLVLPERVLDYRDGKSFVDILDEKGRRTEKEIETGLGDGMTVEVSGGLSEGDVVLERTYES
jgi:multidrug efflux pump subunit AcrA (membrane-fusion protein)